MVLLHELRAENLALFHQDLLHLTYVSELLKQLLGWFLLLRFWRRYRLLSSIFGWLHIVASCRS